MTNTTTGLSSYNKAMDLLAELVAYYDTEGIYDEYEKESDKMVTSSGVYNIIKQARAILPERLKGEDAGRKMRDMPEDTKTKEIEATDKVIDARTIFSQKMAKNKGAQGLLAKLVDSENPDIIMAEIKEFVAWERGENG